MKLLQQGLKIKQTSPQLLYKNKNVKVIRYLTTNLNDDNNENEQEHTKHLTPDYLKINTTMNLIPNQSIIPICDHMKTGTQFVKCLKIIDLEKILGVVISLNSSLKYPPTRKIGQRVVVKIRDKELRVLDLMLQDLPANEIHKVYRNKYGLLAKQPTEEEKDRMERSLLIEGETLMTVIDKSGAEYVKYMHPIATLSDSPVKEVVVQVLTLSTKLHYTKRNFPDIDRDQLYTAKLTKRNKTFTRNDGTGDFTKIEFCAELIEKIE